MAKNNDSKVARLFELVDGMKERLVCVEALQRTSATETGELRADMKDLQAKMNQIIGKNAVIAAIYGVVGSIIVAVVTFFVTSSKGS